MTLIRRLDLVGGHDVLTDDLELLLAQIDPHQHHASVLPG